jgi:hypothetical protein
MVTASYIFLTAWCSIDYNLSEKKAKKNNGKADN